MNAVVDEYADQLWGLPRDLADLFEAWLPRLRAAFGPWRRPLGSDPLGDPDGYGGIDRQGSWERLLITEWALAREVPDEFVRRAAMREQLFLRLERVIPAAAPHTRVWVDGGATQVGAPRLAQLAVLVVLARRAAEAGGRLSWAPAHEPLAWRDRLDPVDVLGTRTLERPAALPSVDGECFALGGPGLRGARHVEVIERSGALLVRVGRSTVELSLPPIATIAGILSAPVARSAPAIVPARAGTRVDALRFAPGGGALFVRQGDRVVAWAVPRGPREQTKSRWRDPWFGHEPVAPLVAVGWHRRKLCVLRATPDDLTLFANGTTTKVPRPAGFEVPGLHELPWMAVLPSSWLAGRSGARLQVFVRDGAGVMWAIDLHSGRTSDLGRSVCDPLFGGGVYSWLRPDGVLVRRLPGRWVEQELVADHGPIDTPLFSEPPRSAWFGRANARPELAVELGDGWWLGPVGGFGGVTVQDGVRLAPTERVCGAWRDGPGHGPSLVMRDRTRVRRLGAGSVQSTPLLTLSGDTVTAAAVGGRDVGLVAVGAASGWVSVVPITSHGGEPWLTFLADQDR